MKLGPSLTPFTDEIEAFNLEYVNKKAECEEFANLLKNLLNLLDGNLDDNTTDNDLFIILNLKEKIETLTLSGDITIHTKKEIHSRFEKVISIFKGVIDIDPKILQEVDKVKFFKDEYHTLTSQSSLPENLSLCLKEVINQKVAHIPEKIITDLRFALGRKETKLNASLVSTQENIIDRFLIKNKHWNEFGVSIRGIKLYESKFVKCNENLELLSQYSDQFDQSPDSNDKKLFDAFKNAIKSNRVPSKTTIRETNRMLKKFSQGKKLENSLKNSNPSITYAFKKDNLPKLHSHSTPSMSVSTNFKNELEAILDECINEARSIPGVKEKNIDTRFESYKTYVLANFENKNFETELNSLYEVTRFDLKKTLEKITKTEDTNLEIDPLMNLLSTLNTKVKDHYKQKNERTSVKNPYRKNLVQ